MTGSVKGPKPPPRGAYAHGRNPHTVEGNKHHNFKVCTGCGETKKLADFSYQGKWRTKRAADPKKYKAKCKDCCRALNAVAVDPNFEPVRVRKPRTENPTKEQKRASAAKYKREQRRETRIKALQYLADKGCDCCGERDPRVLEFDHIRTREKEYNIAILFSHGYSWGAEKLRTEIRKCRVVCANCHRKHTIVQQEHYSHDDVKAALRDIFGKYDIVE